MCFLNVAVVGGSPCSCKCCVAQELLVDIRERYATWSIMAQENGVIVTCIPSPCLVFAMAASLDADPLGDSVRAEEVGGNGMEIPVGENGSEDLEERRAPQGYQYGSGAGGLSTEDLEKVVAAVAAVLGGAGHR